jgi:hypothetical protein
VHLNSAIEGIRVELRGVISSSWAGGWHLRTGKQFADAVHPHAGSAVGEGTTLATHDGGKRWCPHCLAHSLQTRTSEAVAVEHQLSPSKRWPTVVGG